MLNPSITFICVSVCVSACLLFRGWRTSHLLSSSSSVLKPSGFRFTVNLSYCSFLHWGTYSNRFVQQHCLWILPCTVSLSDQTLCSKEGRQIRKAPCLGRPVVAWNILNIIYEYHFIIVLMYRKYDVNVMVYRRPLQAAGSYCSSVTPRVSKNYNPLSFTWDLLL